MNTAQAAWHWSYVGTSHEGQHNPCHCKGNIECCIYDRQNFFCLLILELMWPENVKSLINSFAGWYVYSSGKKAVQRKGEWIKRDKLSNKWSKCQKALVQKLIRATFTFYLKVREQLRFHGIEAFKFLGSDARSDIITMDIVRIITIFVVITVSDIIVMKTSTWFLFTTSAKSLNWQDVKRNLTDTACAVWWLAKFSSVHILGKISLSGISQLLL